MVESIRKHKILDILPHTCAFMCTHRGDAAHGLQYCKSLSVSDAASTLLITSQIQLWIAWTKKSCLIQSQKASAYYIHSGSVTP